jgi:hypothetical protein
MYDGAAGETGGPGDLEPDEVGLPSNAAWLIAVSDDDEEDSDPDLDAARQFLENTQYQSYNDGSLDCVDGEANSQADNEGRVVIDLDDVKPGDFGEVTFDFILCDNPGFVWLNGSLRSASENGVTEPEADDPDEEEGVVELLDVVQAAVWVDDGNNFQNADEEPLIVGSLNDVLGMELVDDSDSTGAALNGDLLAEDGGGAADARNCFSADTVHSVVFAWWVPVDHGNEIQSDTASFDLGFYTEQCRHNDGSGMNNDNVDDGEDGGGTSTATVSGFPSDDDDGNSLEQLDLNFEFDASGTVVESASYGGQSLDTGDVSFSNGGQTLELRSLGGPSMSTDQSVTVELSSLPDGTGTTTVGIVFEPDDDSSEDDTDDITT